MTDRPFAILPYGTKFDIRLAKVPLDKLNWPFGRPADLSGTTVGDLPKDFDLVCLPSDPLFFLPWPGVKARVSVWIVEPSAVQWRYYYWLILLQYRFRFILSREAQRRPFLKNAVFYNVMGSSIPENQERSLAKTRNLSLIASAKKWLPGHKLRHVMAAWLRAENIEADIVGRGFKPIDSTADGLAQYRFSLVIENSQEPGYFSEKLMDALICKTVPIYWGDPLVAEAFDIRGMIVCKTKEDMQRAVRKADSALYESMSPFIETNYQRTLNQPDSNRLLADILARPK
jgi:hypothetical protein